MFKKGKKKAKPKSVGASASSVISDLSNPSDSSEEDEVEMDIPDPIAECSISEEEHSPNIARRTIGIESVADSNLSNGKKKSRKKKKKRDRSNSRGGAFDDDDDDDDDSVDDRSTKSGRSTKSSRSSSRKGKKKKKKKKRTKEFMDDIVESDEEDFLDEFEALQDEVLSLRRKLSMREDTMEMTQLQMDFKRAMNESNELKSEIDEYEEAVAEKDGLIKKLTEAVDCQLDKVEYLELKLQRAEEEFVKMEDEMRGMEDEVDEFRDMNANGGGGEGSGAANGERMAELDEREHDLEERENDLLMKEQELLDREKTLVDREETIEIEEEKLSDQKDDLRMKELQFEEREREILENEQINSGGYVVSSYELEEKQDEINTLKRNLALKTGEVHELRGQLSRGGARAMDVGSNALREENDRLKVRLNNYETQEKEMLRSRNEEIRKMQMGSEKQTQDLHQRNEALQRRIEAMTLEQADIQHSDIHDQLKKKDEFARRQQQELEQVYTENETLKDELGETSMKLKKADIQVREFKGSANKKTKQKDETIDFMQSEMVRLTMEKQQLDEDLQEMVQEIDALKIKSAGADKDEEAEMLRIQAFNEQIRVLDEKNQELQSKLEKMETDHSKQLDGKEREMEAIQNSKPGGARNRIAKERELTRAQSELAQSKERIQELESTIGDLRRQVETGGGSSSLGGQRTSLYSKGSGAQENTNGGSVGWLGRRRQERASASTSRSPSRGSRGLWSYLGGRGEQQESTYDQNNKNNIVPHTSPAPKVKKPSIGNLNIAGGPIITGQSIEDELRAIEQDAKKYEDSPKNFGQNSLSTNSTLRVDMAGQVQAAAALDLDNSSAESGSGRYSSSSRVSCSDNGGSTSPKGGSRDMNIASRLAEMRAKRNRGGSKNARD